MNYKDKFAIWLYGEKNFRKKHYLIRVLEFSLLDLIL